MRFLAQRNDLVRVHFDAHAGGIPFLVGERRPFLCASRPQRLFTALKCFQKIPAILLLILAGKKIKDLLVRITLVKFRGLAVLD